MKITLLSLLSIMSLELINSASKNDVAELVTYKNINGFEIKHKPCQVVRATYSYDYDTEDVSTLDSVLLNTSCDKNIKRFVSFSPAGLKPKSQDEINSYFEDVYKKTIKYMKEKGSITLYVPDKKYLKDNNFLFMYVANVSPDGYYRWYIKKQCGLTIHALEINIIDVPVNERKSFESKITSGTEIIPPEEKKIIDSFKCIEFKPKQKTK